MMFREIILDEKAGIFIFSVIWKMLRCGIKVHETTIQQTVKYKSLYGAQLAVFNKGPTSSAGGSAHARPHKKQCEEFKTIPRNAH